MVSMVLGPYKELIEHFTEYRDTGWDIISNKRVKQLLGDTFCCIRAIPQEEGAYRELYSIIGEGVGVSRLNQYHLLQFAENAYSLGVHYYRRSQEYSHKSNRLLAVHYIEYCLAAYDQLEKSKGFDGVDPDHLKRIPVMNRLWEKLKPLDKKYGPLAIRAKRQLLRNRFK